jgi:hypothetical protein
MAHTYAQVSAATASGDTTKTLIDTITVTAKAKRIIGLWCTAVGAATLTTGEAATGIFELESSDLSLQPLQLPLDIVDILTSGAIGFSPRIFPVNIPVAGQERISGYVTMDQAQTGALKARFGIITEGD